MRSLYAALGRRLQEIRIAIDILALEPSDRAKAEQRSIINSRLREMSSLCQANSVDLDSYLKRHGLQLIDDANGRIKEIKLTT